MARARSPNREKAFEIYKENGGNVDLVEIAKTINTSPGTVRGWKAKDRWEDQINGAFHKNSERSKRKKNIKQDSKKIVPVEVKSVIENPDLTDEQRLFCLYYSKSFNATRSYQKAYGCDYTSALRSGPRLLEKVGVKNEIMKLKQERYVRSFISEEDIFQKYWDIAFSDITDFLSFGRREVQVMGAFGPVKVKDENGKEIPLMKEVNSVEFRESFEVDGSIISEVRQGKDGVSVKLADRMKALQWLSDHMDLATNEQQTRIDKMKLEMNKLGGEPETYEDDGFLEALAGKVEEIWEDE